MSSASARPDWSSVSCAKRERVSSVARRACVRRRAATTSLDVSARRASGFEEEEDGLRSGPRRGAKRVWEVVDVGVLVVLSGGGGWRREAERRSRSRCLAASAARLADSWALRKRALALFFFR